MISRFGILTNARQWVPAQKRPDLTLEDSEALRQGIREASHVGAITWQSREVSYAGQTMRASVRGVTANTLEIRD